MRLCWDFRLFSFGYGERGVGAYTRAMALALWHALPRTELCIWAEQDKVPREFSLLPATWIPYRKSTWKSDLVTIPFLIKRYGIDIFHYWVALGPVFRMGMGLFHPCRTCATIHDLGVEKILDDPFCSHVKRTWYWKFQKHLVKRVDTIVCNSKKTRKEVLELIHPKQKQISVIYLPVTGRLSVGKPRLPVFIALAGAPHKNLKRALQAFTVFRQAHPAFTLTVLGDVEQKELPETIPPAVVFEGMDKYNQHLETSAGLIFCSTYEGLGIPPLEAMAHGCPLVVSNSTVFHETCENAGRFVNPFDVKSIAEGMADVADHQHEWVQRSLQGYTHYKKMSDTAGSQWGEAYSSLWNKEYKA